MTTRPFFVEAAPQHGGGEQVLAPELEERAAAQRRGVRVAEDGGFARELVISPVRRDARPAGRLRVLHLDGEEGTPTRGRFGPYQHVEGGPVAGEGGITATGAVLEEDLADDADSSCHPKP